MKTFKVDDKGDLIIQDGDLVMIEGDDEIVQSIERRLSTNQGEWFLDTEFGLDYESIRGKDVTKEKAELVITEAVYQDERIEDTAILDFSFDNILRLSDTKIIARAGGSEVEIDSLGEVLLIE